MDWMSTACGDKWNINEILKICQDRNEYLLIANVRVMALTSYRIGLWDYIVQYWAILRTAVLN